MSEFIRRHSLFITSALLIGLSCQLMSASIKNVALPRLGGRLITSILAPAQEAHHEMLFSLEHVWSHYIALQHVETERDSLLERVKNLEAENSRLIEFESENVRLQRLLSYKERTGAQGIVATVVGREPQKNLGVQAQVIGRDPSNWARTITINRGSDQGIRPGLAVVDGNAIVGQTTAVSANTSKVLLLTDNTSSVDALVQTSRAQGTVEGTLEQNLRMRFVLREDKVNVGDRVIASGLDGVFPKGTLVGVVTLADKGSTGLFQHIEVQPSVDFERLENVFVITDAEAVHEDPLLQAQGEGAAAPQ